MREKPLYQKLMQNIKNQIITGIYKEGDLLPSEHDLMKINNCTRFTVRQALAELVNEGYILKKQGLGSVVNRTKRKTLGLLSVKGFSEAANGQKLTVKTIILQKPSLQAWDNDFFFPVSEEEKNAGCIFINRIRCVENEPVMHEKTYLANLNLPKLHKTSFLNGSLFETLNVRYQVEITKVEQDLRAVSANKESADLLKVEENSPLLHIFLKFHTNREFLFIYGSLLCNTKNYLIGNNL